MGLTWAEVRSHDLNMEAWIKHTPCRAETPGTDMKNTHLRIMMNYLLFMTNDILTDQLLCIVVVSHIFISCKECVRMN